jgi:calcium/calmodulin-dependent protein kinase I
VRDCLTIDPASRPTASEALRHPWLADERPHFVPDPANPNGGPTDLLPQMQKAFNAKKTCALLLSCLPIYAGYPE